MLWPAYSPQPGSDFLFTATARVQVVAANHGLQQHLNKNERGRKRGSGRIGRGAQFLREDPGAGRPFPRHEAEQRLLPVGRVESGALQPGGVHVQ